MAKPTKHLTDKGVEAVRAPVGKDREYITDTGPGSAKGLNLMVTAKGSKSWVWRSRHPLTSKQVKKTLGNYPAVGLADARAKAGEYERARLDGYDLDERNAEAKAARDAEKSAAEAETAKTLRWFWDTLYCPRFLPVKAGNETVRLIEKHLLPTLGNKPIATITFDDLDDCVAVLAARAPKSADRFVINIKTLFKRAKREFRRDTRMASNPSEDLMKPDGTVTVRERALSENEIFYFYRAMMRATGVVRVHAECLALLLDVGGRLSEAREMPWDEVDFESGVWELPPERSKNGKAHKMLLPVEVLDRLQARKKLTRQRWVFWSPLSQGQPYNALSRSMSKLKVIMSEIAAKDGVVVESWSAHTLRHTFKTHLYEAAARSLHPLVTEANVDRAQNHTTGSVMGRRYDKNQYLAEKGAVYRFWQNRLLILRERAAEAVEAETHKSA
jgi:integrase